MMNKIFNKPKFWKKCFIPKCEKGEKRKKASEVIDMDSKIKIWIDKNSEILIKTSGLLDYIKGLNVSTYLN